MVTKAVDPDGVLVALKRFNLRVEEDIRRDQGFDMLALREIRILKKVNHRNIVDLREVVTDKTTNGRPNRGDVYMSLGFCEFDLDSIICNRDLEVTPGHVQSYMYQILDGLQRLHGLRVLHRDLKPANILVTAGQEIKITDFGMSKFVPKGDAKPLTTDANICTLWYRPPEIILGDQRYGEHFGSSDVWSAGVIFAELLTGGRVTKCAKERDQLEWIFDVSGAPSDAHWPKARDMRQWSVYQVAALNRPSKCQVRARFGDKIKHTLRNDALAEQAILLLEQMLELDPAKRITADKACDHDFFWLAGSHRPAPEELPRFPISELHSQAQKELAAKQREQAQRLLSGGFRGSRGGRMGGVAGAKRPFHSMPRGAVVGSRTSVSASRSPSAASAVAAGGHRPGLVVEPYEGNG